MLYSALLMALCVLAVASDVDMPSAQRRGAGHSSVPQRLALRSTRSHSGYIPFVVPVLVFAELLCTRGDVDMRCTEFIWATAKNPAILNMYWTDIGLWKLMEIVKNAR
jgi:hypothetical protein